VVLNHGRLQLNKGDKVDLRICYAHWFN
jgi:hypothetical protein